MGWQREKLQVQYKKRRKYEKTSIARNEANWEITPRELFGDSKGYGATPK